MYYRHYEREIVTMLGLSTRNKTAAKTSGGVSVCNMKITHNIELSFSSVFENSIFELCTKFRHQMLGFDGGIDQLKTDCMGLLADY